MKKNMGMIDRIVRIIIAAGIGAAIYFEYVSGTAAIVLGIIGGIFILTSIVSFCPLYLPFKISTMKK